MNSSGKPGRLGPSPNVPDRRLFRFHRRYRPDRPLPPRPFLPGTSDPRPAESEHCGGNDSWCLGVDLYNRGYFWEAHEAWEAVWMEWPRDSATALLARGCIQSAAALLKLRLGVTGGVEKLSTRSLETLSMVKSGRLLGLDVEIFRESCAQFWCPLAAGRLPLLAEFPRLELNELT